MIKFRRQISVQRRDGWIERAAVRLIGAGRDRHGGAKFYLYDLSSPLFSAMVVWLLEQMMRHRYVELDQSRAAPDASAEAPMPDAAEMSPV